VSQRNSDVTPQLSGLEACSVVEVLSRISGKWAIGILLEAGQRPVRFTELERSIDGISRRMLTLTLRNLERDGLVNRTVTPTIPPRVDYELTSLGSSLQKPICGLATWATENVEAIHKAQARYDAQLDQARAA